MSDFDPHDSALRLQRHDAMSGFDPHDSALRLQRHVLFGWILMILL